jgi:glycosyl transferase family 25
MIDILKGIDFSFFNAVDGSFMNNNQLDLYERYITPNSMTKGEVGCFLSHILVWEKIKNQNIKNSLVLEDDIKVKNSWDNIFSILNSKHINHFDIIMVGHCHEPEKGELVETNDHYAIHKTTRALCTHAYIISYNGACKLLEHIKNKKSSMGIDEELAEAVLKNIITSYSIYPSLIDQDGNNSIIGHR